MDPYERLIGVIRKESERNKGKSLIFGEMTSNKECRIDGMTLDADDLYASEHLTKKLVSEIDMTADAGGRVKTGERDKSKCLDALKKGDKVLLYRISEDKYVIITKVVSL